MKRRLRVLALALLGLLPAALPAGGEATVRVEPQRATVGDPIEVQITLFGDDERRPAVDKLGPDIGPFSVLDERWSEESAGEGGRMWRWTARIAAYETGTREFPATTVAATSPGAPGWEIEPFTIEIASVLEQAEAEDGEVDIADLKGPASVAPDLRTVWLAGSVLVALLAVAAVLWWLNRRYAARLAAVPPVEDPFARIAPHEWAFAELRKLLDEEGRSAADRFYERLAWILKRYLGGRYRTDLLELTTDEVRPALQQAGAPGAAMTRIAPVLGDCDAVKFAKYEPSQAERKDVVDRVYDIIDQTKPVERPAHPDGRAGAA